MLRLGQELSSRAVSKRLGPAMRHLQSRGLKEPPARILAQHEVLHPLAGSESSHHGSAEGSEWHRSRHPVHSALGSERDHRPSRTLWSLKLDSAGESGLLAPPENGVARSS